MSPSSAVPPDVPKPGKVTFAVFAVIALACPDVMPVFAVLAVMADACPAVMVVVSPANAVELVVPS